MSYVNGVTPAYVPQTPPAPPPVDDKVRAQVDTVLGPNATQQQREQAYKLVQESVDKMGGVGDAGIVEEAIPAHAAKLLRDNGIPTVASQEVIAAVDSQLPADAAKVTPQQRREAYEVAQKSVDAAGGIGASGVKPEALPAHVAQALRDKGLPTRIQQEVVDAMNAQLGPEATPEQRQRAYDVGQKYVDKVGGIGDAGIVKEALPNKFRELLRENRIPSQITNGEDATAVFDRDFNVFDTAGEGGSTDGKVSEKDLRAVAENKGGRFTPEQQRTAQYLLNSQAFRSFLDVGAGKGSVDGTISREDVNAARQAIASGSYSPQLLDTAAGKGERDKFVSQNDLRAALNDPGVPQDLKDAINLLLRGADANQNLSDAANALSPTDIKAASELARSPRYAALSDADKKLVSEVFRDSKGQAAVSSEVKKLIESQPFQSMPAAEKTAALTRIAVLNSPEFKALPSSDQDLVREALRNASPNDTQAPEAIRSLLKDQKFQNLNAAEKTAVLSQVRNYPGSQPIENIKKLVQKDWFDGMSLADKQRTLKTIAYASVYAGGNNVTLQNTLRKILDEGYSLNWERMPPGVGAHSNPGTKRVSMNLTDMPADNNRLDAANNRQVYQAVNALPHEISHAIHDDHVESNYKYLNAEYRAYVTGTEAQNGRPMTRQEAAGIWRTLLDPNGIYAGASSGALGNQQEANQIFAALSRITGVNVNAQNFRQILNDPAQWNPPEQAGQPSGPLTGAARPQGNTTNQ